MVNALFGSSTCIIFIWLIYFILNTYITYNPYSTYNAHVTCYNTILQFTILIIRVYLRNTNNRVPYPWTQFLQAKLEAKNER